ncbi:DUF4129 domain-containing protein [Halorubellus litoreus]|uniref:DUF4129 domain-containing protein n=1 Tax=Halorubellus litoreus TaxID=755308 RepID=A0ABD5VGH4_9EURY
MAKEVYLEPADIDHTMRARGRVVATCLLVLVLTAPTVVAASTPSSVSGSTPTAVSGSTPTAVSGSTPGTPLASDASDDEHAVSEPPAEPSSLAARQHGFQDDDNESSNGTTVQHEDPDAVDENGDLGAVKGWLSSRMLNSLQESSVQITQGQYEAGKRALGDEYTGFLGQYVDVAGETDARADDRTANTLNATRAAQRTYANTSQEYEATYEAYQEAKANGNDARARELARELTTLSEELRRSQRRLNETYTRLGNLTGQNLSSTVEEFESVTENVTEEASTIQAEELVATELTVSVDDDTISFLEPAVLRGQLRVLGNASMPDEVRLRIGGRTRTVGVAENGSIRTEYRPRTTPVGDQRLPVAFVPDPTSLYVGTNASVNVTVVGVTPRVTVDDVTAAGYGDRVPVAGRVTVDGVAVDDVPVAVTVAGSTLATVRTGADGRYRATPRLPADVSPGEVTVRVRAGETGRAVDANVSRSTLLVETTGTDLSLDATATNDDRVQLSGTFTTDDGTPVGDQRVVVRVAGERVAVTRTDADGRYRTTARVDATTGTVTVRAVYDGTGTNLADSSASQQIELQAAGGSGDGGPSTGPGATGIVAQLVAVGPYLGGGLAVVVALAVAVRWRRQSTSSTEADVEWATDPKPARPDSSTAGTLEDRLDELADSDPNSQVQSTYHALRNALRGHLDISRTATHWELYRAVVADAPELDDDLRTVVEAYERVTFAETDVDDDQAAAVRTAAHSLADTLSAADTVSANDAGSTADTPTTDATGT